MKKKLLTVLGLTMIVACLGACGSNSSSETEQTETASETTENVEEQGDVIEETELAIFDNDVFSFKYDPQNFMVTEDEESVTVSFYNEEVQTAGSNVIIFTKLENSDAKQVVSDYMKQYDATEDEMVPNYLGGDDVEGYSYSTGNLQGEGSELKTCETFHAVPCGENVILIDKLRTLGDDMDLENSLDAQLDEVILSFQLD